MLNLRYLVISKWKHQVSSWINESGVQRRGPNWNMNLVVFTIYLKPHDQRYHLGTECRRRRGEVLGLSLGIYSIGWGSIEEEEPAERDKGGGMRSLREWWSRGRAKKGVHSRENSQLLRGQVRWGLRSTHQTWLVTLTWAVQGRGGMKAWLEQVQEIKGGKELETTGIDNLLRVLLERRAKKWVSSWSEFGVKRRPMSLGSSKDSSSSRVWTGRNLGVSAKGAQLKLGEERRGQVNSAVMSDRSKETLIQMCLSVQWLSSYRCWEAGYGLRLLEILILL